MIRSTRAQKAERLKAARRLLADKPDMAEAAVALSRRFGLSRRQAYRYLALARGDAPTRLPVENSVTITLKMPASLARSLRERARHDDKRTGQAGRCGVAGAEASAWLSGGRHGVPSISSTNSIDCWPSNSRLPTTSSFPIGCGSSVAQS
jgi:hypothetical protein